MADVSGVIPDFEIEALLKSGAIRCDEAPEPGQIQPASLDLRLAVDAYRLRATLTEPTGHRVGLKGTARLQGRWVPLAYWVLRRPLASVRAAVGW